EDVDVVGPVDLAGGEQRRLLLLCVGCSGECDQRGKRRAGNRGADGRPPQMPRSIARAPACSVSARVGSSHKYFNRSGITVGHADRVTGSTVCAISRRAGRWILLLPIFGSSGTTWIARGTLNFASDLAQ